MHFRHPPLKRKRHIRHPWKDLFLVPLPRKPTLLERYQKTRSVSPQRWWYTADLKRKWLIWQGILEFHHIYTFYLTLPMSNIWGIALFSFLSFSQSTLHDNWEGAKQNQTLVTDRRVGPCLVTAFYLFREIKVKVTYSFPSCRRVMLLGYLLSLLPQLSGFICLFLHNF